MTNLTILNTSIRKFNDLYSLNDLHFASGGEDKHRPSHFLRLEQTKDLISAIQSENSNVQICTFKIIRGAQGGTYACEELALAYATWISPKFHLVVLRAFIAMHKGEVKQQQLALPEPEYNLATIQNSEETLVLLIKLYSYCHQAHEMQEKLSRTHIASQIENAIGGHYLHNFKHPLEQAMKKAKAHIHANAERLTLIKAVNSLFN